MSKQRVFLDTYLKILDTEVNILGRDQKNYIRKPKVEKTFGKFSSSDTILYREKLTRDEK